MIFNNSEVFRFDKYSNMHMFQYLSFNSAVFGLSESRRHSSEMSTNEPILKCFHLLTKWTSVFMVINFAFPVVRAKNAELKIKAMDKFFTVFKLCVFATVIIIKGIFEVNSGNIDYDVLLMYAFGLPVLITNLFIEIRHRLRIWSLVSGLCDVDIMVCSFFLMK